MLLFFPDGFNTAPVLQAFTDYYSQAQHSLHSLLQIRLVFFFLDKNNLSVAHYPRNGAKAEYWKQVNVQKPPRYGFYTLMW